MNYKSFLSSSIRLLILTCLTTSFFSCEKQTSEPTFTSVDATAKTAVKNDQSQSLPPTLQNLKKISLQTAQHQSFEVFLAITDAEQTQGFSGVKPEEIYDDQGMLFVGTETEFKSFWMPDTYFNLDIFFIDENLQILAVERNVKFYHGREHEELIPRTRSYLARHVLELKASSALSATIKVGDKLIWTAATPLEQIKPNTPVRQ